MKLFQCKHTSYIVTKCEENSNVYICKCIKCNYQFTKLKAIGEMYQINNIITRK